MLGVVIGSAGDLVETRLSGQSIVHFHEIGIILLTPIISFSGIPRSHHILSTIMPMAKRRAKIARARGLFRDISWIKSRDTTDGNPLNILRIMNSGSRVSIAIYKLRGIRRLLYKLLYLSRPFLRRDDIPEENERVSRAPRINKIVLCPKE